MAQGAWPEYGPGRCRVEGGIAGAQQARRDRRAVVVAAVHRRAGVVRHERPAGPRPQLRPRRARCSASSSRTGYVTAPGAGLAAQSRTRCAIQVLPLDRPRSGSGSSRRWPRRRCSAPGCWPARCRTRSRTCSPSAARRCSRGRPGDLEMSCSCPDWEVPCKHLAAVCYLLAEAFDDDPFGMLAWRGRGREKLLAALRRISAGRARAAGPGDQRDRPAAGRVPGRLLVARAEPGPAAGACPPPR